jgi:hypothetical protein
MQSVQSRFELVFAHKAMALSQEPGSALAARDAMQPARGVGIDVLERGKVIEGGSLWARSRDTKTHERIACQAVLKPKANS